MKRWAVIGINIIAMFGVVVLLGWAVLTWLNVWTGHGDNVAVPDVSGMSYDSAEKALRAQQLRCVLSDSVYTTRVAPGFVTDQNPPSGAVVKPGREVYLTINATQPKTVTLPSLTDVSLRQARAIVEGLGLTNIVVRTVPSDYKDLVLGVQANGRYLQAGARVPVTATITLEVGEGTVATDTLATDTLPAPSELLDLL